MIAVIDFTAESQRSSIDEPMALLTWILANLWSFDARIASVAQSSIVVSNESGIGQLLCTQLATEALRMPTRLHRLDDSADDDVAALVAEGSIKNSKILLAVLATLKLVEDSILERAETLSASKRSQKFNLILGKWTKVLTQSIECATIVRSSWRSSPELRSPRRNECTTSFPSSCWGWREL